MDMPLFPLHVVLFPGSAIPLHVFEPRYRAMMDRVLNDDRRFGVVAIRRGREAGGYAETFRIGTVAVIEQVQRTADGSMAIIVTGHDRFALDVRLPDAPYPLGEVTLLEASDTATRLRLCADMAKREAMLLEAVGPSVGRPTDSYSPN